MTPDLIDDLLDRSVPATRAVTDDDLSSMIRASRREVARGRGHRPLRLGVAATVATMIVTGSGIAVAGGLIEWSPKYAQPDTAFDVTLASGRQCELRLVAGPDEEPFDPTANAALRDWLNSVDLMGELDLDEGRRIDAEIAASSPDQTAYLGPEGWLMDVPFPPDTRSDDDIEAAVVHYAAREAIFQHMAGEGYDVGTFGLFGSIKCAVDR